MYLSAWLKIPWLDEIEAANAVAVKDENLEEQSLFTEDLVALNRNIKATRWWQKLLQKLYSKIMKSIQGLERKKVRTSTLCTELKQEHWKVCKGFIYPRKVEDKLNWWNTEQKLSPWPKSLYTFIWLEKECIL